MTKRALARSSEGRLNVAQADPRHGHTCKPPRSVRNHVSCLSVRLKPPQNRRIHLGGPLQMQESARQVRQLHHLEQCAEMLLLVVGHPVDNAAVALAV